MQNKELNPMPATQVETEKASEQPQPQRKKSKLRWVWRLLLLIFILLFAGIVLLTTGKGQQSLLNTVSAFIDELEVENVEGSLQDGLTLTNASYQMDGVKVKVGQADLHIGFHCAFSRKACIENLALKDTEVVVDTKQLPPSEPNQESKPLGKITLPLDVAVERIQLDNVKVKVDELDIHLNHFASGVSGKSSDIIFAPTKVEGLHLSLAPESVEHGKEKAKEKAKEVVKATDWNAVKARLSEPLLSKLAPVKLPLYFALPDFTASDIRIEQKKYNADGSLAKPIEIVNVSKVAIQGKSDEQKVELDNFEIYSDKGNITGKGELTLSDNYPLKWSLKGSHPELKDLKIPASFADVEIEGELFGKTQLNVQSSGAATFHLQGDVRLAEPKMPMNLSLKSEQLNYPFIPEKGAEPLKLSKIDLKVGGNLLDYNLKGNLNISGMNLPSGSAQLDGKGDITYFQLQKLHLNALDGKAELTGKVDWKDGVEWHSVANLSNVNTKGLLPEWAAVLSGKLQSNGYAARGKDGKAWSVTVDGIDISGSLFQKKLQLKGALTTDYQTLLNIQPSQLIYGENIITANGILGDKSDFSADINAPNLKGLIPNLAAGIKGKVKMQGKLSEPRLDLDLVANNVAYDNLKLQHLTAKGKVTTEKQINADLNLNLTKFSIGEILINQADAVLQGTESNHSLKLVSKGEPVGGNLQINGGFDRNAQIWQGQLSNVSLQSPIGIFQNDKAVQVRYDNKQISTNVSAHCWRNAKLTLCFPENFNAGVEGKVPFDIRQFELSNLQEYLDKNTQLSGLVNAKGDVAWFKNKAPQVNVELTSNSLKLNQKLDNGAFPLVFSPVKITAKIVENNLSLNSDIRLENNGRISGDVQMKELSSRRILSGNINIDKI